MPDEEYEVNPKIATALKGWYDHFYYALPGSGFPTAAAILSVGAVIVATGTVLIEEVVDELRRHREHRNYEEF